MSIIKNSKTNSRLEVINVDEQKIDEDKKKAFFDEFYKMGSVDSDNKKEAFLKKIIDREIGAMQITAEEKKKGLSVSDMENKIYKLFLFFKSI